MFEIDRLPAPDEMGFFCHPDIPDLDEESVEGPLAELGFECKARSMVESATGDVVYAWFREGDIAAPARWNPEPPHGDGWILAAKYDTEDGPHALFVRPNV